VSCHDNKVQPRKITNMNKIKYIAAVLIAIAGFGLQQASAFTSDLNKSNFGFTGPYGTVTITLVGQTATVTFTSNTVGGNIYLFGDGSSAALNVNATSFTVGTITGTNAGTGFTPGPYVAQIGSQQVDGFGLFNLTINSFDGFTHAADTITFTVTNTSLTPWVTANDVIKFNAAGFDAAAHIFVTSSPANASNSAIITGFAGEGPQSNVPDGGTTVMLLGAALGALGMARRFIMS
jgi:VPDSG-CTERM motif